MIMFVPFTLLLICIGITQAFDPNNVMSYDQNEARRALFFSYGAYCDATVLESWTCKFCEDVSDFTISSVISNNGLQAFVGYDNSYQRITVVFRGTTTTEGIATEFEDWIDNLDYSQMSYPYANGYVHSGFYESWQSLTNDGLAQSIQNMLSTYPKSDILFTGHSLGAALAQIGALSLTQSSDYTGYGSVHVITFGSPRWCDQDLAALYDGVIDVNWRIVNEDDLVSTVPYTYMGENGFHHTAQEIRYTDTENLKYVSCSTADGEDEGSTFSGCYYIGWDINDHLRYLNIDEGCPVESSVGAYINGDELSEMFMASTTDIEMCPCDEVAMATTMEGSVVSATEIMENEIVGKFKKELDNVSKIVLCVALGVGWLLCFIFCCCWCKTRRSLMRATRRDTYFQLHDV